MSEKIGIIGGGTMGEAITSGLLKAGQYSRNQLFLYDPHIEKRKYIKDHYDIQITTNNIELVKSVDVIILAIKPYAFETLFEEIRSVLEERQFLISIAAGMTIQKIESFTSNQMKIARTMPNTASRIREGITGYTMNKNCTRKEEVMLLNILSSIGSAIKLKEEQFDVFTSICASSPAFLYYFIEALSSVGEEEGLSKEESYIVVAKAMKGAALMILNTMTEPSLLRDKVCTKGGTTIEGIKVLEENHFYDILREAAIKTALRSKELSK